jgi:uncharacterized membrane protein (DUF2068 family)
MASFGSNRPLGVTISCLALGWLALAGFGNALVIPKGFASVAPQILRAPVATVAWLLAAAAALYGVTAMVAAIGLWRMRAWGQRAYRAWVVVVCGVMLLFLALVRVPADTPPLLAIAFVVTTVLILGGWWRYIRKAYARAGTGAP